MATQSWRTIYASPPLVKYPYNPRDALADIPGVSYALELFLASHMVESEDYCDKSDEKKERMYFATGYGLIQCVKGLMSYADEDLLSAIGHTKRGNHVANQHRKKAGLIGTILGSTGLSSHSAFIRSMTDVERHAELTFAESLFEKALLGIVYSGDWLAFIKEALNMRTTISIYRQLLAFLEETDAAYAASRSASTSTFSTASASNTSLSANTPPGSGSGSASGASTPPTTPAMTASPDLVPKKIKQRPIEDPSIDPHLRSGIYLGAGMCNIILSLMPGKLATFVELFGYHGDRKAGLDLLGRASGWDADEEEPQVSTVDEGLRRSVCDMALLIFHLVLSNFTVEGVDIGIAARILEWNLKRYPDGVFFLFGAGRLALQRSQPREAIAYYSKAMQVQQQYRNLHHVSFWEIAMARLALWEVGEHRGGGEEEEKGGDEEIKVKDDVSGSAGCWRVLEQEAGWSKSIYTYGLAACLLEDWDTDTNHEEGVKRKKERVKEASRLMAKVPGLKQKIAGKSIPLEKFVARKARKYAAQKGRLVLPALEVAYVFQSIAHAPRGVLVDKMVPEVRRVLRKLAMFGPGTGQSSSLSLDGVGDGGGVEEEKEKGKGKGKKEKEGKGRKGKALGPERYEGGAHEYWDDLCLARFLEGVCLRFVAYPDPDAVLASGETVSMSKEEAERGAEEAFRAVFEHGPKIELDHHLVYHAHYELGRLLACQEKVDVAKAEFELVLSGKYLEVGPSGRKGKYSMENSLHMRTHAALDALHTSVHNHKRL